MAHRDFHPSQRVNCGDGVIEAIDAISVARVFVLILSSRSSSSAEVRMQFGEARDLGLPVVPVLIEITPAATDSARFFHDGHVLNAFSAPPETYLSEIAEHAWRMVRADTDRHPSHGWVGFDLVNELEIKDGDVSRKLALYCGDLCEIPIEHAVDFLVVSAFPNDYSPASGTVIGALASRGLSVRGLANDKLHDLRNSCGFWISRDLTDQYGGLNARHILCFEPAILGSPPKVVGELFRGLFPFLDMERGSTVATSLVASGAQACVDMFPLLVGAAIAWLRRGLPLNELKIVVRSRAMADLLGQQLSQMKLDLLQEPALAAEPNPVPATTKPYDIFLSYSSVDADAAMIVKTNIEKLDPSIRIFDFKQEIDVGKSYQTEIDRSIQDCRRIVALMSPSYFRSPECQEELQMSRLRNKREGLSTLFPVYWISLEFDLSLWLQILNYSDCRERDGRKLAQVVDRFINGRLASTPHQIDSASFLDGRAKAGPQRPAGGGWRSRLFSWIVRR